MISCQNVLSSQNLIPCFLTFCSSIKLNPYLRFEFLIFLIMLFIHAKHHNLSAGTQNVTGAYVIIMLVNRCLLTMRLHGKAAV